jgi:hypothetical protein
MLLPIAILRQPRRWRTIREAPPDGCGTRRRRIGCSLVNPWGPTFNAALARTYFRTPDGHWVKHLAWESRADLDASAALEDDPVVAELFAHSTPRQ